MNAQECGFETPENYQTYESINTGRSSSSTEATQSQNVCINVCFRILRDNNGSNAAINPSIIPQILAEMNSRFNPHGISFYQIGTYDYINNTSYSNKITFLSNQFLELSSVHNTSVVVSTERYEKITTP